MPLFSSALPAVLPFTRAYWVLPGRLLAGYVPVKPDPAATRQQLRQLLAVGIRTFVNLMHEDEVNAAGELIPGYEDLLQVEAAALGVAVTHHRLPIVDLGVPTPAFLQHVLDVVDASLAAQQPVYVHCWGGRGRTGTVVGCYLARHGWAQGESALAFVEYLRRTDPTALTTRSPETAAQRQLVRSWSPGQ